MQSNCLIEAVKAWLRHPLTTRIGSAGGWSRHSYPHFFWVRDDGSAYHFQAHSNDLSMRGALWFAGRVAPYRLPHGIPRGPRRAS